MNAYIPALTCVLLLGAGTVSSSAAQGTSAAAIVGVVRDTSGALLPGVTVEAASDALIERSRTTVTDDQGQYRIIELRPGTYTITYSLTGFSTLKREGVTLASNFTATMNADLRVGQLEESITVTGAAPLVDVQNVTQQKTITKDLLDAVPTGRATLGFAALMPAAVAPAGAQDVGGSKGETSVRMSIHGARQADQRLLQDGMSYNWISGANGRSIYINPLGAQEVVIDTGSGGSAEYATGGAQINLVPKDGGNRFNGTFFAAGTNHALQANTLTEDLSRKGLQSLNGIRSIYDLNAMVGGPLRRDNLWFMSAHRRWGRRERIANLFFDADRTDWAFTPDVNRPGEPAEDLRSDNLRLTWQATPKHKFTVSYDWQHNNANNQGGGVSTGTLAMEAIINPDAYCNRVTLYQGTWTRPATSHLLLEAGATFMHQYRSFGYDIPCGGEHYQIPVRELSTGFNYHGTGTQIRDTQYPFNHRASVTYLTGRHNIKIGMQSLEGIKYEVITSRSGLSPYGDYLNVSYTFRNGSPTSLTEFVSPRVNNGQVRPSLGIFAQDQWTLKRLTVTGGLRYEYLRAYAPESDQPGGFPNPAPIHFARADCLPCWHDLNPRIAASYDLFGDGKTAVKASAGRYIGLLLNALSNTYAPANSVIASATRSWGDANRDFYPNCDLRNPATNGECGPMNPSTFGTLQVRTTPDPDWIKGFGKRDYNWRTSLSVDRQLWAGTAVNVGYYRAWYGNFTATDNTLVTPLDYDPYCVTAPTDPRLGAISGTQVCGLYDIKPALFGQVNNVVGLASKFGKQTDSYNGVDVNVVTRIANANVSGGWNIGNSFATGNVAGITFGATDSCFVVDSPQQLFNCQSGNPYQNRFKVNGSMPLAGNVQVAVVYQNLPGAPYTALTTYTTAQIAPTLGRNLAGNTATVTLDLLPAGAAYLSDRVSQLDVRASKLFRIGGRRLQANFDVFNILNNRATVSVSGTSGASWLVPTSVLDGRMAKFSAQVDF